MSQYKEPVRGGDLFTIQSFRESVRDGFLIDDDGFGYPAKDGMMDSDTTIYPSELFNIPKDATHVVWFNK